MVNELGNRGFPKRVLRTRYLRHPHFDARRRLWLALRYGGKRNDWMGAADERR
jgi:hypothetical protein